MSKRAFRKQPGSPPKYPTLEQFDENRRTFLGHLGAALLGALVLGELPDPHGNNGRKRPEDPKKKGKKKDGKQQQKKKKKKQANKNPLKRPRVFLGFSTGNNVARIDEVEQ